VAGIINGLALESSSHRHGLFPMNVTAFDVVLANGDVLEVTPESHPDLYATLPGSYGTLGIVTKASIQLVDARPFVHSRYRHFERASDYVQAFSAALGAHDFIEGFVMARDSHVLVTSDFSDARADLATYHAMKHGNLWYYEHATAQARLGAEDVVPTYEYLFRHLRSLLWVSRFANFLHLPMTRLGRWLIDRRVTRDLREFGLTSDIPHRDRERSVVMQDCAVVLSRLEEALDYVKQHFGIYPFWNCPVGRPQRGPYAGDSERELLFITDQRRTPAERRAVEASDHYVVDLGLYGEATVPNFRHQPAIRAFQKFVDMPAMWGVSYLTQDELEEIFDIRAYEAIRRKYHAAEAFPHVEEKVLNRVAAQANEGPQASWRLAVIYHRLKNQLRGAR
jgi:delta24-sterol reductase